MTEEQKLQLKIDLETMQKQLNSEEGHFFQMITKVLKDWKTQQIKKVAD